MNKFNKKVIELLMTKKSTQRKSSNDNFSFNAEIQGYFLLIKVKFIFMQDFCCFTLKCSLMALIISLIILDKNWRKAALSFIEVGLVC